MRSDQSDQAGVNKPNPLRLDRVALLLLFVLGMHYWQPNLGGLGLQIPANVVTSAVLGLCIAASLIRAIGKKQFYMSPLLQGMMFPLLAFFVCYPIQLLVGLPVSAPSSLFIFILAGWLFVLSLHISIRGIAARHKLIGAILLATLIQAVLSIGVLSYSWLVFGQLDLKRASLFLGVFQQPNVMASFLATGLASGFWYLNFKRTHSGSNFLTHVSCVSPLLLAPLLLMLQSRVGWLGAILVILLIYIWLVSQRALQLRENKIWIASLVVGALLGGLVLNLADSARREISNLIEATASHRTEIWQICWSLINENKWFGVGYGNFESAFLQHQAQFYHQNGVYTLPNLGHPHNELLMWGAEGGTVLAGCILLFVAWLIRRWWRTWAPQSLLALALLAPIAAHTMTEMPFNLSVAHWLILLSALYLLEPESAHRKRSLPSSIAMGRPIILLLSLANLVFMLGVLQAGAAITQTVQNKTEPAQTVMLPYAKETVWNEYSQREYLFTFLDVAIEQQDPEKLLQFTQGAEYFLQGRARLPVYRSLVSAYFSLGMIEQAQEAKQRMDYLFPPELFGELDIQLENTPDSAAN